ncbi:hypothetical protein C2869_21015 [Saccharobesus litoralis]|uniref:Cyclic nucleotide-binding domain-containing protein n=1 Tax=Saccharobesus litoralis TaxID=2172099 RepID=A0A2S0VX13_9ALTE|nr:cyclic nucleotide-binding domain-containing protein [Saccharobesus litoralis]AWB68723.1 hypothetical protein C2869_21015 [Saccharobesus litoralis]
MENTVELRKGQTLFTEGEKGRQMYVISHGQIRLTKGNADNTVEIATLGEGEFVGEMALLTSDVRTCTAVADSDVSLLAYDEEKFKALIKSNSGIALRLIEGLAQRLKDTTERLVALQK